MAWALHAQAEARKKDASGSAGSAGLGSCLIDGILLHYYYYLLIFIFAPIVLFIYCCYYCTCVSLL